VAIVSLASIHPKQYSQAKWLLHPFTQQSQANQLVRASATLRLGGTVYNIKQSPMHNVKTIILGIQGKK